MAIQIHWTIENQTIYSLLVLLIKDQDNLRMGRVRPFFLKTLAKMAESKPSRKEIRDASLLKIVTETGYHLESYFDRLKDYTFNTTWMELTQNYAKALVEARARRLRGEKESDLIQQLSADIDESIKKLGCEKVFVRMSTRSAKDVALQREQALIIFQEEDKKLIEETQNKYREDVRHMI